MIADFAIWMSRTGPSQTIQKILWIIPTIQTIHILAIAIVLSSAAMLELRIMGWTGTRTTMSETAQRYIPFVWGGLIVLALSGSILVIGEPERELTSIAFQIKMGLLLLAIAMTAAFQIMVRCGVDYWSADGARPLGAKLLGLLTLLTWFAIAVAGRWIAYVDLDKVTL